MEIIINKCYLIFIYDHFTVEQSASSMTLKNKAAASAWSQLSEKEKSECTIDAGFVGSLTFWEIG